MKFIIVLAALVAVAYAGADVSNLRSDSDVRPDGFKWGYENSDGQKHDEEGQLKNAGTDNEGIAVHGSYSYVGDDGVTYSITYTADENGFQPQGAHIPVA